MICKVETPFDEQRFYEIVAGNPFFDITLSESLRIFGAGGALMNFYLSPSAAILHKGESAVVCGTFDSEELGLFLQFMKIKNGTTEGDMPDGYEEDHVLYNMLYTPSAKAARNLPSGFTFTASAKADAATQLLFAEESQEARDNFYSATCTRLLRGGAVLYGAEQEGKLVSIAGALFVSPKEAYLAAVQTVENLRGRGIGGVLVNNLSAKMAASGRAVTLSCYAERLSFYERLGFVKQNTMIDFKLKEEQK